MIQNEAPLFDAFSSPRPVLSCVERIFREVTGQSAAEMQIWMFGRPLAKTVFTEMFWVLGLGFLDDIIFI